LISFVPFLKTHLTGYLKYSSNKFFKNLQKPLDFSLRKSNIIISNCKNKLMFKSLVPYFFPCVDLRIDLHMFALQTYGYSHVCVFGHISNIDSCSKWRNERVICATLSNSFLMLFSFFLRPTQCQYLPYIILYELYRTQISLGLSVSYMSVCHTCNHSAAFLARSILKSRCLEQTSSVRFHWVKLIDGRSEIVCEWIN